MAKKTKGKEGRKQTPADTAAHSPEDAAESFDVSDEGPD
jgi:hypothetical protein